MKKQILFFVSSMLLATSSFAQDDIAVEKLMTRRLPSCNDIAYNASYLLPALYNSNSNDTIGAVTDYWQRKCGKVEPLVSFDVLHAIDNGTFTENMYDDNILNYLLAYKHNAEKKDTVSSGIYKLEPLSDNYYDFLASMASSMLSRKNMSDVEKILVNYYATRNKEVLKQLDAPQYNATVLQQGYRKARREENGLNNWGGDVKAGIWMPDGNLSILGAHPSLGVGLQVRGGRLTLGLDMDVRFLHAANDYSIFKDSVRTTNYFSSYYIGLFAEYSLVHSAKSELNAIGGIGYDDIYVIKSKGYNYYNDDNYYPGKQVGSWNVNAGLEYRYYYHSDAYFALQGRYNVTSFVNNRGTDFSGNATTIGIIWGGYDRAVNKKHFLD